MAKTVLIVEDAEFCRDTLEIALMKLPDLAIHSVTTAEEALLHLSTEDVCALVTDLHLPLMDGLELITTVRSQKQRAWLPILVISGDSDPLMPQRAVGLGANAYFGKPYSPAAVTSKLRELLSERPFPGAKLGDFA